MDHIQASKELFGDIVISLTMEPEKWKITSSTPSIKNSKFRIVRTSSLGAYLNEPVMVVFNQMQQQELKILIDDIVNKQLCDMFKNQE